MLIKQVNQADKVCQGAREAIHLVDHDHIHLASLDVIKEMGQGRALGIAAREAAIVIVLGQGAPAFMSLALDIGFTGLSLRIQGVEGLLQAFFGLPFRSPWHRCLTDW